MATAETQDGGVVGVIVERNRRTKFFKNRKPNPLRTPQAPPPPPPPLVHKIYTPEFALHRGFLIKIGDIVALRRQRRRRSRQSATASKSNDDHHVTIRENGDEERQEDDEKKLDDDDDDKEETEALYFAQIRAILNDQYGEKSAVITWLIPTESSSSLRHRRIRVPNDFDPSLFTLGPVEECPRPLDTLEFVCRPTDAIAAAGASSSSSYDYLNQYKSDLLRHKFGLEDLAASNFRITVTGSSSSSSGGVAESSSNGFLKHDFISD